MFYKKETYLLILILLLAAILRFNNLMHDAPYFFNPDERNMANAISQFRLPSKLSHIPICLVSQFFPNQLDARRYTLDANSCNLNPHFFAYGQFPLYLAYFSDQITKPVLNLSPLPLTTHNSQPTTSFPSSIFWLRFWSALSSTLTVLFVYLITNKLFSSKFNNWYLFDNWKLEIGNYAALIAAFSPGLIQSAHFGTTESFLTFFFLTSVYLSINYLGLSRAESRDNLRFILLTSLTIGLALGSKLTGIFFLIPPLTALMIQIIKQFKKKKKELFIGLPARIATQSVAGGLILIGSISFFILSSPYNFIDFPDFKSAVFGYEQDVATGKYEAFYTRQFVNTTPILFQAEKIFPYALGWPVFILGIIGFLIMTLQLVLKFLFSMLSIIKNLKFKIKNYNVKFKILHFDLSFCILHFAFLIYFLPNSFLFAKWTRFMTPILPFFSIFAAFALLEIYSVLQVFRSKFPIRVPFGRFQFPINVKISEINKFKNLLGYWIIGLLVLIGSITPGMAFMSIYTHEDSRVQASRWIYQNIPNNSYILSETANVVDIPLSLSTMNRELITNNYTVISFDFYHLDNNQTLYKELISHLEKADYIFIPSRRIFANYMSLSKTYSLITKYYQLLFSGRLGFEKVVEISSFPSFSLFQPKADQPRADAFHFSLPDETAEETFTVFDHPVIRIYRKSQQFSKDQYKLLFET